MTDRLNYCVCNAHMYGLIMDIQMRCKYLVFALILASQASCSSDSGAPDAGFAVPDNSIPGLWNLNPSAAVGEEQAFFEITNENIIYYVYQGSNGEFGENCYDVDSEPLELVTGSIFTIGDRDLQSDIQVSEGTLMISFVDVEDDDGDGDTTEEIVEIFPRVENINVIDLNPCR